MAHLWIQEPTQEWAIQPLTASELSLDAGAARLIPTKTGDWVVVTGADRDLRVNGRSLPTGIRVLEDRDELRLPGSGSLFFSTEVLAQVAAFPGSDTPHACPRCKLPLEKGDEAVKCPQCEVWTHEGGTAAGEDRRCWSYADTCALCHQKTAADEGFQWTPEEL